MEARLDEYGTLHLAGALTFENVTRVWQVWQRSVTRDRTLAAIDLEGVNQVDSAGLALLLDWQSQAGGRLRIRNAPEDLLRLAALCAADELLDLHRPANRVAAEASG